MPANFDSIARWYTVLETLAFGGALQRCRVALLNDVQSARHVLIVGEGNGRFLEALLNANTVAEVTVIDSSRRMILLASARVGPTARVRFVHGDLLDPEVSLPSADLVVTQFFLDCFNEPELEQVIARLCGALKSGGRWLWADFAIPDSGAMRLWSNTLISALYSFFRFATGISARQLPDPVSRFSQSHLSLVKHRVLTAGLLIAAIYQVNHPVEER